MSRSSLPASDTDDPTTSAIAAKYGNAESSSTPATPAPSAAADAPPPDGFTARADVLAISARRRHQMAQPPATSAMPAASSSACLTVALGLGTSEPMTF